MCLSSRPTLILNWFIDTTLQSLSYLNEINYDQDLIFYEKVKINSLCLINFSISESIDVIHFQPTRRQSKPRFSPEKN